MTVRKAVLPMDYIKGFEKYLLEKDRSQNTIECYIKDVKQLGGWASKSLNLQVQELAQINLTYFKRILKSSGQSLISINRKIAGINAFYRYIFEKGVITEQLVVTPFKIKKQHEFHGLESNKLWRLRTEIHRSGSKRDICILEILLNTGIRVSELVNIKISDIKMSPRKGILYILGKGEALRTVPLNKDARKAISDYLAVREESSSNYLFIGQRGVLRRNAVNLILKKYGKRVGVEISAHKLRHSLGYALIKQGKALTTIKEILGHESISTTQIYTVTTEADRQNALEEVEW